jgi:hypothetical protein
MDYEPRTSFDEASRRRHERRKVDKCVSVINGKTYPVENWSLGGVLLYTDSKTFAANDEIEITMKFKLRDSIMDITHKARIIRKSMYHVALEFQPLSHQIKKGFQSVVDDFVSQEFAQSQHV